MAVLKHKHSPPKCPVCGESQAACGGEKDVKPHPKRMTDVRGAIFNNPAAVIVPDTWDEGTIKRDEAREAPMYATERIIIDGRQHYAVGQRIKREDIEALGIVDGKLVGKGANVEAEGSRTREQSARTERSEAEQQSRQPKRRGRPPGSRNRRREKP